jgi:hypothetical protein
LDFIEFTAGSRSGNKNSFLPIFRRFAFISALFYGCLFSKGDYEVQNPVGRTGFLTLEKNGFHDHDPPWPVFTADELFPSR